MTTKDTVSMVDSTASLNKALMNSLVGDLSGSFVDICCTLVDGWLNWERNATGHTISKSGLVIEMFDWLSLSMKFKYECLPQMDSEILVRDNVTNKTVWTSLYKVKNGACNVSPRPYVLTYDRFKDYNHYYNHYYNHIITNYYSSVMTSLITTTVPVPIIVNSLEEVANNENIDVMIVKDYAASVLITVINHF